MTENNYTPLALIKSLFLLPRQSLFRKLKKTLVFMLLYSILIGVLDYKRNIIKDNTELGQFHLLFSFCLSIIIAFRINVAYNRWWEARTLWGILVNNCRNLTMKINSYIGFNNDPRLRLYLQNFPLLLCYHLRKDDEGAKGILQKINLVTDSNFSPTLLLNLILNKINDYHHCGKLNMERFLALDAHFTVLTDVLGGCERIRNTPPPPGFSLFTRFALLFYMLIFPFGWINSFGLLIAPIIMVLIYVLLGLEILAEEIEEPFGTDSNDLPLDSLAESLSMQICEIADFKISK